MQVRSLRTAGASAVGDEIALLHRKKGWRDLEIHLPGLAAVLFPMDPSCESRKEFIEMAVYSGIAVGMIDIDSLSEAFGCYRDAGDIAVGRGIDRQVHPVLGPDVQSHVVVIGAEFPKVGGQAYRDVQWIAKVVAWISGRRGIIGESLAANRTMRLPKGNVSFVAIVFFIGRMVLFIAGKGAADDGD